MRLSQFMRTEAQKANIFAMQVCETAEMSICNFIDSLLVPESLNHPSDASFFPLAFPPCFFKVTLMSSWKHWSHPLERQEEEEEKCPDSAKKLNLCCVVTL